MHCDCFNPPGDLRSLPVIERKERLRKLMPSGNPVLLYVDYIKTSGMGLFKLAASIGMEGIIAKRADSPYVAGRSRLWLKGKQRGFHEGWERPLRR